MMSFWGLLVLVMLSSSDIGHPGSNVCSLFVLNLPFHHTAAKRASAEEKEEERY